MKRISNVFTFFIVKYLNYKQKLWSSQVVSAFFSDRLYPDLILYYFSSKVGSDLNLDP